MTVVPSADQSTDNTKRDLVFDAFVEQELQETADEVAEDARTTARVAHYGAQYRKLFPQPPTGGVWSGQRNSFQQTVSDAGFELGERIYGRFCAKNPGRANPYRVIYEP